MKNSSNFKEEKKGKPRKKKKSPKTIGKILLFLLVFTLCLPIFCIIFYQLFFFNKIYPFVKVAGIDLTGKTTEEAEAVLSEVISDKKKDQLTFSFDSKKWHLSLDRLKFDYSVPSTANKAFMIGRYKDLPTNFQEKTQAFWQKYNLNLDYQLDYQLLDTQIATIAAQIDLPAIPPTIEILDQPDPETKERITIIKGESGKGVNQDKLKKTIRQQLDQLEIKEIPLPVEQTLPEITEEMAKETKNRAIKLLGKKITLQFQKDSWEINEKELISFLSFDDGWDDGKIITYTQGFAETINRPAQDALFNFQGGRVLEFKPAKEGRVLDEKKTKMAIIKALEDLMEDEANKVANIGLFVSVSQPKVTTAEVNNLGIKELIGEGVSWFYGSIAGRIHNIKLATSKINGVLIAPGETFSFNKTVGEVSAATGYQQAYIIEKGRTVLGDGGGLCQISTTLFRAALNSGLPIVERRAHAYRVSYYEYNSGPGLDATVYEPSPDFKFKNDTSAHILIQTSVNTANMKLTYKFYGTSDGRKSYLSEPRVWDQVPPPPDLYQDDPTLPIGVVKQIDWKAWGAKAAFDWKVTRGSEVLQERTFYSSYRPWQAIFLRGTKAN